MKIQYIRVGDYFIPDLELPQESRPMGKWGRMHREYLREHKPIQYNCLLLSGKLWTYLADLNEQAQDRLRLKMVILHQKHIFGLHIMPENGIITASTHFYCQTD